MKYFTLQRWLDDQELTDAPFDWSAKDGYEAYLASIRDGLPADLRRLLTDFCIHDSNLLELAVGLEAGVVGLRLAAGNATMREGRHIRLTYLRGAGLRMSSDPKVGLSGPFGFGDLGNDELELLPDGSYEHRLLFSSGIEMAISFRDFRLEQLDWLLLSGSAAV